MDTIDDRWLSADEIGRYLGVTIDTVYRWIDRQNMPAHKVARRWMFKQDEVDEWVRSSGSADTSDKPDTEQ
jgi:excisionase family DNA binding protein